MYNFIKKNVLTLWLFSQNGSFNTLENKDLYNNISLKVGESVEDEKSFSEPLDES